MAHRALKQFDGQGLKEFIIWFIGAQSTVQTSHGPKKVKQYDGLATWKEIKKAYSMLSLPTDSGKVQVISRRHVYRLLKELREEGYIEPAKKKNAFSPTFWKLTPKGMIRWSILNNIQYAANVLPVKQRLGVMFALGPKKKGKRIYIDCIFRIADPDYVDIIEKGLLKKKPDSEELRTLAELIESILVLFSKDTFRHLAKHILKKTRGKEDLFYELVRQLPIFNQMSEDVSTDD